MTTWLNAGLTNAALTGALLGLGLAAPPTGHPADTSSGRRRPGQPSDQGLGADAARTGWMPRYPYGSPSAQPTAAGQPPANPTDGFLAGSVTALASATPAGWDPAATAIGPWGEPTRLTRMPQPSSLLADLPESNAAAEGLPQPAPESGPHAAADSVPPAAAASVPAPTYVSSVPVPEVAAPALAEPSVGEPSVADPVAAGAVPGHAPESVAAGPRAGAGNWLDPLEDDPLEDDPLGTGSLDRSRLEPALLEPALPESPSYRVGTAAGPSMVELAGWAEPPVAGEAGPAIPPSGHHPGHEPGRGPAGTPGYEPSAESSLSGYGPSAGRHPETGTPLAGESPAPDRVDAARPADPARRPAGADPLSGGGPALGSLDSSSLFEALSRRTG